MNDSPVLRLRGAAFTHPGGTGVSGLDLDIAPGEAVALIGPNGAGKSTLLKGVLGLVPRTAGTIEFGARTSDAGAGPSHAANGMVGFLPQSADLDPDFPISVEQVVMQGRYRGLGLLRWPGRADRAAVRDALETVGLAELAKRPFGELSGGQRQRGLLARALASDPGLLLLDEPFNGLDQPNRDALVETLRALKARGVAVLVSTHDLDLARRVCDSVVFVNRTQLASGPVDDVLTLGNVQECFEGVEVEIDEHTLVVPGHEGH
ncbi:manganese/iron transport system ATP-binding protein [Agromyces hippuratus]|uniref:Manganese/iron transport system ATP-binding protein n=1 Tax=Agromyces hippuratus TaxID=286438 RepID=A0A852WUN8_9MICO|nr:metal ABC transporter ATP-binding protein [Agromyces hippuratus]NYG21659.1 manganese/iron transport system ATP-binding protein [Agromyces hippuratus]